MEFPAFNCQVSVHCSPPRHLSLSRALIMLPWEHNGETGRHWNWGSAGSSLPSGSWASGASSRSCPLSRAYSCPTMDAWAPREIHCYPAGIQPQPRCGPVACGAQSFPVAWALKEVHQHPWASPADTGSPSPPSVVTTESSSRHCQVSSRGRWPPVETTALEDSSTKYVCLQIMPGTDLCGHRVSFLYNSSA